MSERTALLAATLVAASRLVWVAVRRRKVTWFAAVMPAVFGLTGHPAPVLRQFPGVASGCWSRQDTKTEATTGS